MASLRNPHPSEILKEEFLSAIGMSQNQLAHAIGVPGNRIHAIVKGTRNITGDTDLRLCKFSACLKDISCGFRTPLTRLKPNAELESRGPKSSLSSRVNRPSPLRAITLCVAFHRRQPGQRRPPWTDRRDGNWRSRAR
jgi:addiction module HigA family antidote